MTQIELFAGIGGFGLAGHWAGIETVCQVEIDPFCQKVLAKNFPNAHRHDDIKTFDGTAWRGVDIVSGGFPCQPYSHAGKRAGNDDNRALWPEMLRVIREVAPAWVVGENVAGLLSMDGGRLFAGILADLEGIGYQTEVFVIPACAVGAPHRRDRVWIVANREGGRAQEFNHSEKAGQQIQAGQNANGCVVPTPHAISRRFGRRANDERKEPAGRFWAERGFEDVADTNGPRPQIRKGQPGNNGAQCPATFGDAWGEHWLQVATRLCRVDDGIPRRLDGHRAKRLKALGNAIVPQVAYQIFKAIQS